MNADEIISALEYNHGKFPRVALAKAIEEKEIVAPRLLQVVKDAAKNIQGIEEDTAYMLHIYALYLLAQFRETDAYLPIVEVFSIPGDVTMKVTGDVVTEDLGRILASTFNGNIEPLKGLIEDRSINEYVRSAGMRALCVLWGCGAISRQEIVDYYKYILTEAFVDETPFLWSSLIASSLKFSPNELEEEIKTAFEEGLIEEFYFNWDDFVMSLGLSNEEALIRFQERKRHGLVEDTISEMENWACFQTEKQKKKRIARSISRLGALKTPKSLKIGRNDPCPCGSGQKYKKCCYSKT